jgi:fluoride exporter
MESLTKILAIGIGGAFGAIARHLLNVSPLRNVFDKFPLPTFLINVAGSFLIGLFLILLTDKWTVNDHLRFAVLVGFLGAFTTFSTFELEIWELFKESHYSTAFVYLFLSVLAGFVGVAAGIWAGRKF